MPVIGGHFGKHAWIFGHLLTRSCGKYVLVVFCYASSEIAQLPSTEQQIVLSKNSLRSLEERL